MKTASSREFKSRLKFTSAIVAISAIMMVPTANAADYTLPTGGTVVGGTSAIIVPPAPGQMAILQLTDRTVINWNSFNIGKDAAVNFLQPSSSSLAVNRVTGPGSDPTKILGTLNANGRVMVLDRNGVIFGKDARVDVGGLIASTGNVKTSQVMSGANHLTLKNFGNGAIVNKGHINAKSAGLVAFVAPTVVNNGVINAKLGRVQLAAGNSVATVDLYGDGLIQLAPNTTNQKLVATNNGKIKAVGGTIQMSAAQAASAVNSVVNMHGVARATSATVTNGKIVLSAGTVNVTKNAKVKGNTKFKAQVTNLNATIDGNVTGGSQIVNLISDNAKINQGLDAVNAGGTVNVGAGTYNEDVVVSKNGVKLLGNLAGIPGYAPFRGVNESIITPHSPGIVINANGVTVDGFMINGANNGIESHGHAGLTIANNVITNSGAGIPPYPTNNGIYLENVSNSLVAGNYIFNTGDFNTTPSQGNGILLKNTSNMNVAFNTINGTLGSGMVIDRGSNISVFANKFSNNFKNGILASKATNVSLVGNQTNITGLDGIKTYGIGNSLIVSGNKVENANGKGISVSQSLGTTTISGNFVDNTGNRGIHVDNSSNTTISGNWVGTLGGAGNINGDGIYVQNAQNVSVEQNTVRNTNATAANTGSGIHFSKVSQSNISQNTINNVDWDGVKVQQGSNVVVSGNKISDVARTGIYSFATNNLNLSGNTISNAGLWGIHTDYSQGSLAVLGNTISYVGQDGILLNHPSGTNTVAGNTINDTARDAIRIVGAKNTLVSGNIIGLGGGKSIIGGNGISVLDSISTAIQTNLIFNVQNNGIYLRNTGSPLTQASISGNFVGNFGPSSTEAAINVDTGPFGLVNLSGNLVGGQFKYGLLAKSGIIDLTGATNTIANTEIGMAFEPDFVTYPDFGTLSTRLQLVGNTIGTTTFIDQTDQFISLGYGAFYAPGFPTLLNGYDATYISGATIIQPSVSFTAAENAFLQTMITDYNDSTDRGLFFPIPAPTFLAVNQADVFNNPQIAPPAGGPRGSLLITGLPPLNLGGPAPLPDFNAIAPAAGEDDANAQTSANGQTPADIEPAAGGETVANAACWDDAAQMLGNGAVTVDFGLGASQMLNDAVRCGSALQ